MNFVIISIGSNHNRYLNLSNSSKALNSMFDMTYSDCLETIPYGDKYKNNFLNKLASFPTVLSYKQLYNILKQLERNIGRNTINQSIGLVDIDIDIIQFNENRLKNQDWERAYVSKLISNLYSKSLLTF